MRQESFSSGSSQATILIPGTKSWSGVRILHEIVALLDFANVAQ